MMKKYIFIFSAALVMAACNNEEIDAPKTGANDVEVKFSSNLENYDSYVVSRLSGTKFDNGDAVALYASVQSGEAPFAGMKTFTADADGNLSSAETFTYQSEEDVTFTAIYPASLCTESSEIPSTITLTATETDGYKTLPDMLYATATGSKNSPTATFNFGRMCTKISVAVKAEGGVDLSGAELYVKVVEGGTFTMATTSVTAPEAAAAEMKLPLAVVADFNGNTYGSTIVAPQTLGSDNCIGIKLNGSSDVKYASLDADLTLQAGKQYIFNITASKSTTEPGQIEISISSTINETPWTDGGITTGDAEVGVAEEETPAA